MQCGTRAATHVPHRRFQRHAEAILTGSRPGRLPALGSDGLLFQHAPCFATRWDFDAPNQAALKEAIQSARHQAWDQTFSLSCSVWCAGRVALSLSISAEHR